MDEGDGDVKIDIVNDINEDLRFQDPNLVPLPLLIGQREIGHRFYHSTTQNLERWGEESLVQRQHSQLACKLPGTPKSTFLMVFSPDGTKVASTHGDHNIYVTDVKTGKCVCSLQGHPRTPWCVAFHPSSNEIIASGCLGGEVRVWDLKGGSEMWAPEKKNVIASLAFHPTDKVLVIATDNELYFWDWFRPEPFAKISTGSEREKVKYVKFDPLGYKLITGIANTRFDRHRLETSHGGYNANANTSTTSARSSVPSTSETCARTSQSVTGGPCRISRFIDRCRNRFGVNSQIPAAQNENSQTGNSTGLTVNQRIALGQARTFARFASDGNERSSTQEAGTVLGPSSLSDPHSLVNNSSLRRRYHPLSTSSRGSGSRDDSLRDAPPTPLDEEIRLGEMRHPLRPVSDDSASSSSLDSSSSVTSGISGTSHERNTRLSLLWASRLNRTGNESDNSAGGGYDLEERRGEGSVMRGGAGATPEMRMGNNVRNDVSFQSEGIDVHADLERELPRDRERSVTSRNLHSGTSHRESNSNIVPPAVEEDGEIGNEDNEEENDADFRQRRTSCARTSSRNCGQGGRWMYYRGKISGIPSSRNRNLRGGTRVAENNSNATASPINRNLRLSSANSIMNRLRSLTAGSQCVSSSEGQDTLAIPGPSGLSQNVTSSASSVLMDTQSNDSFTQTPSSRSRNPNHSLLDPQFGVQLLSRHIENMQRICRSLSIPRAHLELTRHRHEISRLQQIRSMLYDIQHQIRSLRASVDQTISEEFSAVASEQSLNSASVNPESLGSELLSSETRSLTDEIELEVNIGEDLEQYSYSTLAEEDPDQLAPELLPNSSEIHSSSSLAGENITESVLPAARSRVGNRSHSRSSASTSRHNARLRNVIRLQRLHPSTRTRSRHIRNRLVWPGLIRRLPSQRRSTRSRLNLSAPININPNDVVLTRTSVGASASTSSLRNGTRRRISGDLRESRSVRDMRQQARDKRHSIRRSNLNGRSGRRIDSGEQSSSASTTNQQAESEVQVRSRHSSDWQRRLRSILVSDQGGQTPSLASDIEVNTSPVISQCRNSSANSSHMMSTSHNRPLNYFSNSLQLESDTAGTCSLLNAPSTSSRSNSLPSTATTSLCTASALNFQTSNRPALNNGLSNGQSTVSTNVTPLLVASNASLHTTSEASNPTRHSRTNASCNPTAGEEEMDETPERLPRAGPPTTSLSSRIAMMLAQQEEARTRISESSLSNTNGTGARPRLRASGISQLRYDQQRRLGRSGSQNVPFPPLHGTNSSPYPLSFPILDDDVLQLNEQESADISNRPVLQSLRSLRQEIISHRNRMVRRSRTSLVSGGDLAGATLAAINSSIPSERDRQRETFRQERRENYRHILQLMADRLNHMMNQSHINNQGRTNPIPFGPDDEEGEIMEIPSLQPSPRPSGMRRRTGFTNGLPRSGGATSRVLLPDAAPASGNNSATSALDSHMYNLRLLVRLALHLIYQLLNFICNQNISYEERPISRLPNPFREEDLSDDRNQRNNDGRNNELGSSSFDLDIEPGLHNLTTLLETVRMASEELRNDTLANSEPVNEAPVSNGRAPDRVAETIGRGSFNRTDSNFSSLSVTRNENGSTNSREENISGSTVRRRLTDFLIRTGSYHRSENSTLDNQNMSGEGGRERLNSFQNDFNESNANPVIQRPLPTTPTAQRPSINFRDIRTPLVIPQIVLSDMSRENASAADSGSTSSHDRIDNLAGPSSLPMEEIGFHLRTFGGIPLRFLGRQNAVDRRSPDSEDSSGTPPNGADRENGNEGSHPSAPAQRSFSLYSSAARHPFRPWNNPYSNGSSNHTISYYPYHLETGAERDADNYMYFSRPYFNHYLAASRTIAGSLFDACSPPFCGASVATHRIQAWDFRRFEIPDISDSYSNMVVPKCKIHFDASVSISVDGNLFAALIPDTQPLTRVGVYSLETKTLGQLLYNGTIDSNTICVSLSPTMRHLVVGIASYNTRPSVHPNEKQVVARIYKLCDNPMFHSRGQTGDLQFLRGIELHTDHRQISLNCIRWMPYPGQGLIYGTNRGQLTILR